MSVVQEQADIQRAEAKRLLTSLFGWGEGIGSEAIDRAVDCIIGAAILEISAIHEEAARNARLIRSASDNPH
jgi:hypothetical protein